MPWNSGPFNTGKVLTAARGRAANVSGAPSRPSAFPCNPATVASAAVPKNSLLFIFFPLWFFVFFEAKSLLAETACEYNLTA